MPRHRTTVPSLSARVRRANTSRTGTNRRAATVEQRVARAVRARTGGR
jgi:hypothetical protein